MRTKSEHAFNYWKRRQAVVARTEKIKKFANMKQVEKTWRRAKYHFWNVLFRLALAEFYLNLYTGKVLVALFNLTNVHKIRVNRLVRKYADRCDQTTK